MASNMKVVLQNIMTESETILNRALDNQYINTGLKIFIGLYAALAAPQLPKSLANIMDHVLVRLVFAFLIVFMATKDPSMALLIAIAFVITLQTANKFRLYNTSLSVSSPGETTWLPSAKDVNNKINQHIHPNGEENIEASVNDQETENASLPSNSVEQFVEEIEGAEVPSMVKNSESIEGSFTSDEQLVESQNNLVPGANQESCVKSWKNQHCIQGLEQTSPNGYEEAGNSDF